MEINLHIWPSMFTVQTMPYSTANMPDAGEPPDTANVTNTPPTYPPTYQYPIPSASIIPGYQPGYQASFHSTQSDPLELREPGLPATPQDIPVTARMGRFKLSISSPNVRGKAFADAAAMALSAERRRNKLGYHRTSIACGHCRHRKIRCVPAPGTADKRCSHCIRLNKACNFYPVERLEQQPPRPDPRRRESKAHSHTNASNTPSPTTSADQILDMQAPHPYPLPSMPLVSELEGPKIKRRKTGNYSLDKQATSLPRGFDFENNGQSSNWGTSEPSPMTRAPNEPSVYWRTNPQESPITPTISPFTPGLLSHSTSWSSHTEPGTRDDTPWSIPQRSVSYSNLEGLQNTNPYSTYPSPPPISEHYGAKSRIGHDGQLYPPPISTNTGAHAGSDAQSASTNSASQNSLLASLPSASISSASSSSPWQTVYGYPKFIESATEPFAPWSSTHIGPRNNPDEGSGMPGSYTFGESGNPIFYHPPPLPLKPKR